LAQIVGDGGHIFARVEFKARDRVAQKRNAISAYLLEVARGELEREIAKRVRKYIRDRARGRAVSATRDFPTVEDLLGVSEADFASLTDAYQEVFGRRFKAPAAVMPEVDGVVAESAWQERLEGLRNIVRRNYRAGLTPYTCEATTKARPTPQNKDGTNLDYGAAAEWWTKRLRLSKRVWLRYAVKQFLHAKGPNGIKALTRMAGDVKKKRLELVLIIQTNLVDDHPPSFSPRPLLIDLRLTGENRKTMWDRVETDIYFKLLEAINLTRPRVDDMHEFYTSSGTQFVTAIQPKSKSTGAIGASAMLTDEFKLAFSVALSRAF